MDLMHMVKCKLFGYGVDDMEFKAGKKMADLVLWWRMGGSNGKEMNFTVTKMDY